MNFVQDPSLSLYLPLYELEGSSLMSKDACGHLCTVTGASWRPGGRSFDGTDDFIAIADSDLWAFGTNNFTIEFWANVAADSRMFWSQGNDNDTNMFYSDNVGNKINFRLRTGSVDRLKFTVDDDTPNGVMTHFALVRGGDAAGDWHVYVDLVDKAKTLNAGAYTASVSNFTQDFFIGARKTGGTFYEFFKGYMGEFRIYNRVLTPQEVQHNYLATKWRYQ